MAFKMDNLTESGVDDVRDHGNGAGKASRRRNIAERIYCATVDVSAKPSLSDSSTRMQPM
ncbi:hypothetical protein E4U14_001894 [Claviceps sp. LM454 group G7]|nr:hypothetical protein E4U14_001894 [Claviceps sp. LM454 group G7]